MEDLWATVDDHIVNERILSALLIMQEELGDTLPQAIDRFAERYESLRETRPDAFTKSREEYGRGFHS